MSKYKRKLRDMLVDADDRRDINAPEDGLIRQLCEQVGYGSVMDAAARLWQRKDPNGAFVVGPARGTLVSLLAQKAAHAD